METVNFTYLTIAFLIFLTVIRGVKLVPQQQAWIVERLGRFQITLKAGLNFIIPFIDSIAYKHSLKEDAFDIPSQTAITMDNVTLIIDGILYIKITDPKQASYGVRDPRYAISQLAQTTMRSELGKITLDKTFEERDTLNANIVQSINEASNVWGIQCLRYGIKDFSAFLSLRRHLKLHCLPDIIWRSNVLDFISQALNTPYAGRFIYTLDNICIEGVSFFKSFV